MKIKTQDYNDVTVIDMQGELDSDVIELFQNTISETITKPQKGIVLDMSEISFIDSEGLEILLWARDYCGQNRRELRLAGLDENCQRILEITRLDDKFDCYAELTGAVKSFV